MSKTATRKRHKPAKRPGERYKRICGWIDGLNAVRAKKGQELLAIPNPPRGLTWRTPAVADRTLKSAYRGVARDTAGKAWQATIWVGKRRHHLGRFRHEDEEKAARAYDKALIKHKLYDRTPNFPDEMPKSWLENAS